MTQWSLYALVHTWVEHAGMAENVALQYDRIASICRSSGGRNGI
jgi:hypothetical protein